MQFFFLNNCGDHDYEKHFDCLLFYSKHVCVRREGRCVCGERGDVCAGRGEMCVRGEGDVCAGRGEMCVCGERGDGSDARSAAAAGRLTP